MILRISQPEPLPWQSEFAPAWAIVEHVQRQAAVEARSSCVTQPSHAALAAEIAGTLQAPAIPAVDAAVLQAIALHDAGWGPFDAQSVQGLRSGKGAAPASFLFVSPPDILRAWDGSIAIAEKTSALGGYLVSRHFWRIAHMAIAQPEKYPPAAIAGLQQFTAREDQRQATLAPRTLRSQSELDLLTDFLQFCDLLSLYLCCGSTQPAEFPQELSAAGTRVRMRMHDGVFYCEPSPFPQEQRFTFAAVRAGGAESVTVAVR